MVYKNLSPWLKKKFEQMRHPRTSLNFAAAVFSPQTKECYKWSTACWDPPDFWWWLYFNSRFNIVSIIGTFANKVCYFPEHQKFLLRLGKRRWLVSKGALRNPGVGGPRFLVNAPQPLSSLSLAYFWHLLLERWWPLLESTFWPAATKSSVRVKTSPRSWSFLFNIFWITLKLQTNWFSYIDCIYWKQNCGKVNAT